MFKIHKTKYMIVCVILGSLVLLLLDIELHSFIYRPISFGLPTYIFFLATPVRKIGRDRELCFAVLERQDQKR